MTACPPLLVFTISTLCFLAASARTLTPARAGAARRLLLAATARGNAPTKDDDGSDVEAEAPRARAVEVAERRPDAKAVAVEVPAAHKAAIAGGLAVAGEEREEWGDWGVMSGGRRIAGSSITAVEKEED